MASPRCFSLSTQFMSALFIVFILVRSTLGDDATEEKIDRVCHQIEQFGFCSQTFHANLQGPADYVGLTQIANTQASINATNTLKFIQQFLPSTTDPVLKNDFKICENAYTIVSQAFRDGINFFSKGDYKSMLNAERIAPRAQASCDVIFNTPPARESPMVERNNEMRILIAMAIVTGSSIGS